MKYFVKKTFARKKKQSFAAIKKYFGRKDETADWPFHFQFCVAASIKDCLL